MIVKESNRMQRVSEVMQKELALLLRREIRDPRLGMVTITNVTVAPDLSHAKIYVSFLDIDVNNSEDNSDNSAAVKNNLHILNHAAGYLRCLLAKKLTLRKTPQLKFYHDTAIKRAWHISELIDSGK